MPLQCSGIACIDDDICEVDHGGVRVRVRIDRPREPVETCDVSGHEEILAAYEERRTRARG